MLPTHSGDMARWTSNARHTQRIKTSINTLSSELATKKHADMPRALGADRAMHFQLTASHAVLESYQSNAQNIGLQLQLAQTSVSTITNSIQALSEGLLRNPEMMSEMDVGLAIHEGEASFKTIVDSLNLQAGGRTIFAGVRTDTTPLPSANEILDDLRATVDFSGSPSDILAEVETFSKPRQVRFKPSIIAAATRVPRLFR